MSFFNHRNNLIHAAIAAALSTINIYIVLSLEPPNLAQGIFGNIFYIHVPVAWTAFLLYLCVMISGILFLTKNDKVWDHRGLAFAEVGTIFIVFGLNYGTHLGQTGLGYILAMGARLTTSLILFLIFLVIYVTDLEASEQVSRYAAVVGILAFLVCPFNIFIGKVLVTRNAVTSTGRAVF